MESNRYANFLPLIQTLRHAIDAGNFPNANKEKAAELLLLRLLGLAGQLS
jgi:hypothetical protein